MQGRDPWGSRDTATAVRAAAEQATTDKELAFEDLVEEMKDDLRYADLPAVTRGRRAV